MSKSKKKRSKKYQGSGASLSQPIVTKVSAVQRGKLSQWWLDHKKIAKPVLIVLGVILLIVWLITEIVRMVNS